MIDDDRLQSAIEPYEDDFEEVLRVVELSSGFVLLPVVVPGPDLAEMLAAWLEQKKHPVTVLAPDGVDDWKNLGSLLLAAKPKRDGVVMVIAGGDLPADLSLPLRLLNERRDGIAKHLDCPLLWCGSSEFIVETGQRAPDFWSVRAVERRIEARVKTASKKISETRAERANDGLLDEALRQGDRKSAEILSLSRLRQAMSDSAYDEFDKVVASIPVGYEEADPNFGFELALMKAEMARRRHQIGEALELLDAWEEKITTPDEECRIDLLRGQIWERAGDSERAEKAFDRAQETPGLKNSIWGEISALHYQMVKARTSPIDWSSDIRESLNELKSTKDPQLHALAKAFLAEATARQHDTRRAQRLLRDALDLYEVSKDKPTFLFGGEAAEAIQRAKLIIDKAQESTRSASGITTVIADSPPVASTRPYFWIALGVLLSVLSVLFVAVRASTTVDRNEVHCFQGPEDKIACGESLEQCEKLRAIAGAATTKPCQKPLFAPSGK